MTQLRKDSVVGRQCDTATTEIDGAILMADQRGEYRYGVEMIACRIWQLLETPHTVANIVEMLLKEYDVERETCEREVLAFLNDAASAGLIRIAG